MATHQPENNSPTLHFTTIRSAVVKNQMLWTAGASLTSAGFLIFFGKELGATGFAIALLLAIPETLGIVGQLSRILTHLIGSRKKVWLLFSIIARIAAAAIPLLAYSPFRNSLHDPMTVLITALIIASAAQAIAYNAYLSWISELVPSSRWGELFSRREIAKVALLVFLPMAAGFFRDWCKTEWGNDGSFGVFGFIFLIGLLLQLLAIIPLLQLPNLPMTATVKSLSGFQILRSAFQNRSIRLLVLGHWWLAIAQGLTQAVFIRYLFWELKIGLGGYYFLMGIMFLLQIPMSQLAGSISDHQGDKRALILSLIATSCAMPFWFLVTPSRWYILIGAYVFWSCFAVTNITGRNLLLKLSPRSDNQLHVWLFRHASGFLAGIAGIIGWLLLKNWQGQNMEWIFLGATIGPYAMLFLISTIGRITTPLWFLAIHEPPLKKKNNAKFG